MSIGWTHTTRPHADASVGPRSGPQIIKCRSCSADYIPF